MNVTVFSAAGRRTLIPLTLAEGSTVQHALEAAGETVPADCEIFVDGNPVNANALATTAIPGMADGAPNTITINRRTKGN